MRVLSVFGTRPEAIKMAPVVRELDAADDITSLICLTGQHNEMLAQVVDLFGLKYDRDLKVMRSAQGLTHVTCAVLAGLEITLKELRPDRVLVHGDTTTAMAAALAAFYAGIPVGHVEAGLRTRDLKRPWPEEANRQITGRLTRWHFAPTARARTNLLEEAVPEAWIHVTGNTVIDALLHVRDRVLRGDIEAGIARDLAWLDPKKRLILVTGHRRESFDGGLAEICRALARLAARGDVEVVYAVHLNPTVRATTADVLAGRPSVHLIEPQPYLPFVWLMNRASIIVTDSGGVQEEAPSLGKPVLVTREVTERPEAVEAGTVRLVGTSATQLEAEATRLLDDADAYEVMARAHNPYGDGLAAGRIVKTLREDPR
ncbi:MAG: non-hydrolyzing UDP-N-acetylglucosamine 2-epimerase [Alphaproteobacteria bacterium]